MLSALNATRVLHNNQYRLRKVLKYQVNTLDQSQEQQSIEEDLNQQPILLIQKILAKATQPSPLKPGFGLEEMQLAVLNLSQFLASEVDFEKPSKINNDKLVVKNNTTKETYSELPTPNSECSVKSIVSEKSSKKKKSEEAKEEIPANPIVNQIVEMGFMKKSVENAIKTLGK